MEMISFGAGVNSVAMTVLLANEGWRGPIVFADPGNEHPKTYCYMDYFERTFLKPRGLNITRINPAAYPHLYNEKRVRESVTLENYCLSYGMVPLLSVRWCSVMFKREPLEGWRKQHGIDIALIGFTDDEPQRIREDSTRRYPLAERGITRKMCYRIIQQAGLVVPRKSGCFFCPGQRLSQWRDLYLNYPELYERAIQLEDTASKRANKNVTLDPHQISLREHRNRRWRGQMQMDLSVWLPCACSL